MRKRLCGCLVITALFLMTACGNTEMAGESEGKTVTSQESVSSAEDTKIQAEKGSSESERSESGSPESDRTVMSQDQTPEESQTDDTNRIPVEYAYAVTVSINPQITLYLDKNHQVVGYRYDNEDAKEAYSGLDLIGESAAGAVNLLVTTAIEQKLLTEENSNVDIELTDVKDAAPVQDAAILLELRETAVAASQGEGNSQSSADEETQADTSQAENGQSVSTQPGTVSQPAVVVTVSIRVTEKMQDEFQIKIPQVTCAACNGTGIYCPGDPDFGKEFRNGTNGYAGCGGLGYAVCPNNWCNGGWITCHNCGGSGKENCHGCGGTGLVVSN